MNRKGTLFLALLLGCVQAGFAQGFDPSGDPALIGWWRCDEGQGSLVADSSPNGNDGTFINGEPAWTTGYRGEGVGIRLVGPTLVEVPPMDLTLTEATIAGWFLPNGSQPDWASMIMHRGPGPAHGFNFLADRRLAYHWNDDQASWSYRGDAYYAADEWTHCAVTVEPDQATFYVNGEAASVNAITHTEATWDGPIWLGGDGGDDWVARRMDGSLDDVMFFSRALAADEIAALVPPRLKAYKPDPADGNVAVTAPLLQWTPGDTAALHDVYFGTDPNLGLEDQVATQTPMTLYFHFAGLSPGTTYYWRVDEIEADMTTVHTGDVWTFTAQPFTSYLPEPENGSNEASPDPNLALTWYPGQMVIEHQVYFGPSFSDVNEGAATTDQGTTTETSLVVTDALQPLSTYYWRVDEIGVGEAIERGEVWSFTTYQPIDDFETYTNETGQRVFEVWVDGIGFSSPEPGNPGNGTGAAVGHDVWDPESPHYNGSIMETSIVYTGDQAMPVSYNNEAAPYYSEAQRSWSVPQNWTAGGADTLVLHVNGSSANAPEPLYVRVEDTAAASHAVVYPDDTVVTTPGWTTWRIPLSTLADAGVNLTAVRMLAIGLGDPQATGPAGAGTLYVDGVWLTKPSEQ